MRYENGWFHTFTIQDGLPANAVTQMTTDLRGHLWVGTNTGGVNRLKVQALVAYGRAEGLPGDGVVPITHDAECSIWIGMTCGGLVRYRADVFPKDAEINVYRIVQECVTNIVKHADATEASVTMRRDNGVVAVTIRDNGKGFVHHNASNNDTRGFGLIGIAERARLFGGEPQIHSTPGQGTTIQMALDVHANNGTGHRTGIHHGA